MVLSIIIISHNQKEQLRRCVNSILSQSLPFEHEIIISDDASSDGTWELAQEYERQYSKIKAFQCNTNDYQSSNNSERGCWNRSNGYLHATGKYIAHIDGDDFLMSGSNIYRKQVELLEQHPECSCCMANDFTLEEYEDVSMVKLRHKDVFETGQILSSCEYIKKYFRESHCCVYRRNDQINPVELYGGYYEDALLTAHYLQFGNIVCLKDAGYVYVQYEKSIMGRLYKNRCELFVMCCQSLYIPYMIPMWKDSYMTGHMHLRGIWNVVRVLLSNHKLREENRLWIAKMNSKSYLYKIFVRGLRFYDYPWLIWLFFYLPLLWKFRPSQKFPYKLLWWILS